MLTFSLDPKRDFYQAFMTSGQYPLSLLHRLSLTLMDLWPPANQHAKQQKKPLSLWPRATFQVVFPLLLSSAIFLK